MCSFLNTLGGNFVYGIDEDNLAEINGITEDFNKLRDKFTEIIKTGIFPKTNEFEIYKLDYKENTLCIINVKEGVSKPYSRINNNGSHNEFIRNNATTDQIEYNQLKRMFNYDNSEEYYSKIFNQNTEDICNHSKINTNKPFVCIHIKAISDSTKLFNGKILNENFIRYHRNIIYDKTFLYQNFENNTMTLIVTNSEDNLHNNHIYHDIWANWLLWGLAKVFNKYDKNNFPSFIIQAEFHNLKGFIWSRYDIPHDSKKLSNTNCNRITTPFKSIISYDDFEKSLKDIFDEVDKHYYDN